MERLIEVVRQAVRRVMRAVARGVNTATAGKLHPDSVTIAGVLLHIPIALLIAYGSYWWLAGLLLVVFGLFDTLDGDLARLQNRVTNNGGFLDASTDRIKEVLLYSGAAYWFTQTSRPSDAVWAVAACGASLCVSYVRAKGETIFATQGKKSYADLNKQFRDGFMPFEVRMVLLIVGLLSGYLFWSVAIIAILSAYTALDRMIRVSRALRS